MAKSQSLNDRDPFAGAQTDTNVITPAQAGDKAFGKADAGRMTVKPIDIFLIEPDFTQPRRALPSYVRDRWDGKSSSLPDLLRWWADQEHVDLNALLNDPKFEIEEVSLLLKIVGLAISIRREKLTNPITVIGGGDRYTIETGERRWLAYHLLYMLLPHEQENWQRIPTRVFESLNRSRQASENTQRDDLNMIARTRQYALLMMSQHEGKRDLLSYRECPTDRDFYAQALELGALDAAAIRVGCGVTSDAALSHYRKALGLSSEQWLQADDESWPRRTIEAALTTVKAASVKREKTERPELANSANKKVLNKVWLAVESGRKIDAKDIDHLRAWLDEVERSLKK